MNDVFLMLRSPLKQKRRKRGGERRKTAPSFPSKNTFLSRSPAWYPQPPAPHRRLRHIASFCVWETPAPPSGASTFSAVGLTTALADAPAPMAGAAAALAYLAERVDGMGSEPCVVDALRSGVSKGGEGDGRVGACGRRRLRASCRRRRRRRPPPPLSQTEDAALAALTALAVRPHLTLIVAASARGAALALACALASGPPPAGAGGADVAVALARVAEVAPHTAR